MLFKKIKSDIDIPCSFCERSPETMSHLFWLCLHSRLFWQNFCDFICCKLSINFSLYWKQVLFGLSHGSFHNSAEFIILLILLAKFNLHKYKFLKKKKNNLNSFLLEVRFYMDAIRLSQNQKALKTIWICTDLKTIWFYYYCDFF